MAKQVVANMDINHDGKVIKAEEPIDPKQFSKDQLTRLYERGAVRIEDASEKKKEEPRETTMDEFTAENEGAQISSVPAETLEPGAKKEAAAKGTEAEVRKTGGTAETNAKAGDTATNKK